MKKNFNVEFWNFICHFDNYKLLDFYSEFVHPAFTDKLERVHGETTWLFHDVNLIECEVDNEILPFIHGRLIKDTVLRRDQVLDGEQLVEDKQRMQSSPSSVFILSLVDHRLFFIKEHSNAPTMEHFKLAIIKFIKEIRSNFINEEYKLAKDMREYHGGSQGTRKALTKANLKVKYPEPEIEIIPLSSDADIDEFIRGMKSIDSLRLDIINPNNESDCNPFFSAIREKNQLAGVKKSKFIISKSDSKVTSKSLPHENIAKLSKEATTDESVEITIKGRDIHNGKLTGTHDEFRFTKEMDYLDESRTLFTKRIYTTFKELIQDGIIRGPKISDIVKVRRQLQDIMMSIRK